MEQLTFDQAIELLEITNISKLKKEDLISLEKKVKNVGIPIRLLISTIR